MAKASGKASAAEKPAAPSPQPPPPSKLKARLMVALIVLIVLLLEGGTVVLTMVMSGGPRQAVADGMTQDLEAEQNRSVEIEALTGQFPNQRTGRMYLYDTEVFVTTRQKDAKEVEKKLKGMEAQLATEVASIFRRADPSILGEDELATLTRQIKASLDARLGTDSQGQPLVQEVYLRKCIGIRADL